MFSPAPFSLPFYSPLKLVKSKMRLFRISIVRGGRLRVTGLVGLPSVAGAHEVATWRGNSDRPERERSG